NPRGAFAGPRSTDVATTWALRAAGRDRGGPRVGTDLGRDRLGGARRLVRRAARDLAVTGRRAEPRRRGWNGARTRGRSRRHRYVAIRACARGLSLPAGCPGPVSASRWSRERGEGG